MRGIKKENWTNQTLLKRTMINQLYFKYVQWCLSIANRLENYAHEKKQNAKILQHKADSIKHWHCEREKYSSKN